MGPSVKDVRSQEGRRLSSANILRQGGFFRCGRPQILVEKKLQTFRNLRCLRTDKEGSSEDKRGMSQFFVIFCERPLWTTPNTKPKSCTVFVGYPIYNHLEVGWLACLPRV